MPSSLRQTASISIHAPHARSDMALRGIAGQGKISIHAPHARSDFHLGISFLSTTRFQSTLLMRGATSGLDCTIDKREISIHAPHARSDASGLVFAVLVLISIHAPHARSDSCQFISGEVVIISIHAPHARSDTPP